MKKGIIQSKKTWQNLKALWEYFFASKKHVDGLASGNSNGTGSNACLVGMCEKTCS